MPTSSFRRCLLVFIGAGLGGCARYGLGLAITPLSNSPFPWATFLINVTGCFAMGALMYLFTDRGLLTPNHRLFLMVGVLGGYTTFSSFGYEVDQLMRGGNPGLELLYALLSVTFGLIAVVAGRKAVQAGEQKIISLSKRWRKAPVTMDPLYAERIPKGEVAE